MKAFTALIALILASNFIVADEKGDRELRARAALALATAKPGISAAPSPAPPPRLVAKTSYQDGYKLAIKESKPIVVFVGCGGHKVTGAVVANVETFADVESPAAVVGYPIGDKVYVYKVMRCPVTEAELSVAVRQANGKITESPQVPHAAPAPKPIDWDI